MFLNKGSIGLKISDLDPEGEAMLWDLYSDYASEMCMEDDFNFVREFIESPAAQQALTGPGMAMVNLDPLVGVIVESTYGTHRYSQQLQVVGGRDQAGMIQASAILLKQGWVLEPIESSVG